MIRRALALVSIAAGCGAPKTCSTIAALSSAQPDPHHDAVVSIACGGRFCCSGSLVGARRVLTAAHCLTSTAGYQARRGPSFETPEEILPVAGAMSDPAYSGLDHDFGVLMLASDARAPGPSLDLTIALAIGDPLELVGFGPADPDGTGGNRLTGAAMVQELETRTFILSSSGSRPCFGDSGGPAFKSGVQVGVASFGDMGCASLGVYGRLDSAADFLRSSLPICSD